MSDPDGPQRPIESMLSDVPLQLTIELGRTTLTLAELAARLGPGSVIVLDKVTGAPLDVRVNARLVARAEAVAVGDRCAIRILEIVDKES